MENSDEKQHCDVTVPSVDQGSDVADGVVDQSSDGVKDPTVEQGSDNVADSVLDQSSDGVKDPTVDQGSDNVADGAVEQGSDNLTDPTVEQGSDGVTEPVPGESATSTNIYHERQKRQLCAMHVLNNLFQEKNTFTKEDMDDICTSLSPQKLMNPHRSMLGLGNYDVNVLMAALQTKDLCTVWFDKRKDVRCLNLDKVKGVIVNVPSDIGIGFLKLPFNFKHWFVIREISGAFYNLDSKLPAPVKLGTAGETLEFLAKLVSSGREELLLVVEPSVEQSGDWKNS